jgi:hypothetical protein
MDPDEFFAAARWMEGEGVIEESAPDVGIVKGAANRPMPLTTPPRAGPEKVEQPRKKGGEEKARPMEPEKKAPERKRSRILKRKWSMRKI